METMILEVEPLGAEKLLFLPFIRGKSMWQRFRRNMTPGQVGGALAVLRCDSDSICRQRQKCASERRQHECICKAKTKDQPVPVLVPCLIVFGLFLFYPFAKTIYLSLYKTDKLGQAKLFVGFGNYIDLFTSKSFYNSLLVTLISVVIVVTVSMLLGLVTALLVNKIFRNPGLSTYALPMAIASSAAALIFEIMLDPTISILTKFLRSDINWLHDERYALVCVALLTAWLNSGINYLYFSAGLANIDESIYERASVDGANEWQKFTRLTLPGLSPILFYTVIVNIILAFQSFGAGENLDGRRAG